LGGQGVTFAEYEDLFSLLLRSSDLGHIPQTLDAVVLASAGKMRLDAPDYVFVLGLLYFMAYRFRRKSHIVD